MYKILVKEEQSEREYALSKIEVDSCEEFSKLYIELSFNLLLNLSMPLLSLQKIFVEKNPNYDKYFCYVQMDKAVEDLTHFVD